MTKTITIITGKVQDDVYGSWEDCSPGTYIGFDKVNSIFDNFHGKNIKVTIEILPEESEGE